MSSDWTTGPNRGTTTATGSVCRSSGRSRGSGFYPGRALTPRLSPLQRYPNRRHEPRLRRDLPLREPSSPESCAAVARRLQRRVCWSFSRGSSTTSPADPLRGSGPLGAREGAGDVAVRSVERSARPLPVARAGLDQAAQRLVRGATPHAILDRHLIASQADRTVGVADGAGPASSRTPHPAAQQTGPQVLRAPVAAALSSPPPDPLPGLAAALRGLTHKAAIFPDLVPSRVHFSADLSDR